MSSTRIHHDGRLESCGRERDPRSARITEIVEDGWTATAAIGARDDEGDRRWPQDQEEQSLHLR